MITEKHENSVYVKRGDSIAEYSQKTYNLIKASNTFKDMHDVVSLFVPGNSSVTCRSGDIYNTYQTPTEDFEKPSKLADFTRKNLADFVKNGDYSMFSTDDRNVMFMITLNIKEGMSIKEQQRNNFPNSSWNHRIIPCR